MTRSNPRKLNGLSQDGDLETGTSLEVVLKRRGSRKRRKSRVGFTVEDWVSPGKGRFMTGEARHLNGVRNSWVVCGLGGS